jgi:hypothetical protein
MFIKIIKYSMSSKNTTTKRKKKGIPKDVSIDAWVEKQVSKQPIIKEETIISYCDTYNPETTLFISIASHASLLLDAEGLPIVVECPLRNVEKKNVSNIGICAKRFMASPFFADPEKIHQLLETDFISESRKIHLRTLPEKTYYTEIINILDEILFTPETPINLCLSIISDFERNNCNFSRTYPTISSIEQSYSVYLALKQKIMERETSLPIDPLIREKFSCNIQKDKPLYWNTLYNMEDEKVELTSYEQMIEAADEWVFETNGHKWSNNDATAGDNHASFLAGAEWMRNYIIGNK